MQDIARDYAETTGFAVFPVGSDCKPGRLAWESARSGYAGVYEATRDPEVIDAFWRRYPDANISVACGPPSGVFVLDVDVKTSAGVGFDGMSDLRVLQDIYGPLPATACTSTPSGGRHIWFSLPERRELSNRVHMRAVDHDGAEWKTGLDVRTAGGCVPVPPSAKPTGGYRWLHDPFADGFAEAPAWLLDIIDPPLPPRPPQQPIRVSSLDRTARYVAAAVDGECRELAGMGGNSGRNLRLFQAAANLGELVGANLLSQDMAEGALETAAQENGLWREDGPHAVRASIRSGMRKGMAHPRELAR